MPSSSNRDDSCASIRKLYQNIKTDNTIYFEIIDEEEDQDPDSQYVISRDEMDKEQLEAVHKHFPFTQNEESETFRCPNWAKQILFGKYTLSDAKRVIKHFNMGAELWRQQRNFNSQKISNLIIDDLDITAMTSFQYEDLLKQWEKNQQKVIKLSVEIPDQLIQPELDDILQGKGKIETKKFELSVNPNLSIYDLKRILLEKMNNQPFFLEYAINNQSTVQDLVRLKQNEEEYEDN